MESLPGPTIASLIAGRTLDAETAALVWLLGEGGLPLTVASAGVDSEREGVAAALGDLVPPAGSRPVALRGDSIEQVLARLTRRPLPLLGGAATPAPGARPGVVLILRGGRLVALHLVRPPLRDAGGHVQRQRPAVLATYDERNGDWDHFAWGIAPEIAGLIGLRAGDVEPEIARRAEYLGGLVGAGVADPEGVRAALVGYRQGAARA
jgi:hypothetical protein